MAEALTQLDDQSNTSAQHAPLLIIGAGPAGYTAAIYGARAGLSPVVIQGMQPGGQLTITTDVENYPGFRDPIQGPWLMEEMQAQALAVGAQVVSDTIQRVDFSQSPFTCYGEKGVYTGAAVIIATGAQAKWLGLPSEVEFRGYGVSACATCDGFFFKNKTVAVVGGGNTAVEEALFLTRHAAEVILIHRRDTLRAEKILQERLFAHPKVRILWHHAVQEILGSQSPRSVTGIRLKNVLNQETQDLPIDGLFVAIGHAPNTSLFKEHLTLDEGGYILTKGPGSHTDIPGIFAAGDVCDRIYRQAVTAAGQGCMAALDAEKFLAETLS